MSQFKGSQGDLEGRMPSSRSKELSPLGTFECKTSVSVYLRISVHRWKWSVIKHHSVDVVDNIVLGCKAFPPRRYALRWFKHLDLASFETFDSFVKVFRIGFRMQEADTVPPVMFGNMPI
jgi:hypothetical protein